MFMPPSIPIAALALTSLLMLGCATTKDSVLPQDLPSMAQIYAGHLTGLRGSDADGARAALAGQGEAGGPRRVERGDADLAGYTREAYQELETRFPRLHNPTLVMFVYPHLAGPEGAPVPGYATAFPMYETVEYALPGEAWEGGL